MKTHSTVRLRNSLLLVLAICGAIATSLWVSRFRAAIIDRSPPESSSAVSPSLPLGRLEQSIPDDSGPVSKVAAPLPKSEPDLKTRQQQSEAFRNQPQSEQQSLWSALAEARRAIEPLTDRDAALPQNEGVKFFAANPSEQLTARFLDGAVRIGSGRGSKWTCTIEFGGAGPVTPAVVGDRVEYHHHGGVIEWYLNGFEGIEQGFTLAARPQLSENGEARIDFALRGLSPRAVQGEEFLDFIDETTGVALLRYSQLKVWDAYGRAVPSRLEAQGSRVAILMLDAEAVYPITIDPLITSQETKLEGVSVKSDGADSDQFGYAVALSGDTAIIGAENDTTAAGIYPGSAYVFVRSGTVWNPQAKLTSSDGANGDRFGSAVALSGDTAIIGAEYGTTSAGIYRGSAYVFVRSSTVWSQQAKLTASEGAQFLDNFGSAVALSGDTAIIGAKYGATSAGNNAGSAYVFVRSGDGWSQQAKLTASDAVADTYFGSAVALSGSTAIIGAQNGATSAGINAGSAYVFVRSGTVWSQQAKLTANDGAADDYFGSAVALSGETAIIGAEYAHTAAGNNAGSAYVFVRSGAVWSQQAKLTASDAVADAYFGSAVALSGETAIIGAENGATAAGVNAGSAYVFVRSGTVWNQQAKLTSSDGAGGDSFGSAIALSGDTALIGAYTDETAAGNSAGSACVFVRSGAVWSQQAQLVAVIRTVDDAYFGGAVALSGDTALIGDAYDDTAAGSDAGSAYVFVRSSNEWNLQKKLTASDGSVADRFGRSVALSGDTALIGARTDPNNSAYVFVRAGTTWTQQAKLIASDGTAFGFGSSVALSGDTALIGSYLDDPVTLLDDPRGSAYVFVRSGTVWSQQVKLIAIDRSPGDQFGCSVALSGDTALIGAYTDDTAAGNNAGSAYVFVRSGTAWSQQIKLTANDGAADDYFGADVALAGDTALIGAFGDDPVGSAYVFVRSGSVWSRQTKLTASDGVAGDSFGGSVALSGDTALVGAAIDAVGIGTGCVYIFARKDSVWNYEARLTDGEAYDGFGYPVALSGDTALVGAPYSNGGNAYVFRLTDTPPVTVLGVSPNSGSASGYTTVTITGENFTGATAVKFGGAVAANFTVDSATKITATTPAHSAGLVDVSVITPSVTGTGSGLYTYIVSIVPGTYQSALLHDNSANLAEPSCIGRLTVTLTKTGGISGQIEYQGMKHSFSGKFSPNFTYEVSISRKNKGPLNLSMHLGSSLSVQVSEFFQSGDLESNATMRLHNFTASKNPAPQAGRYTARLNQGSISTGGPVARGYLVIAINKSGVAKISGKLPDSTAVSFAAFVSDDGSSAFFDSLYKPTALNVGYFGGEAIFAPDAGEEAVTGSLEWQKPAQVTGNFWPLGFRQTREIEGSLYTPPVRGERVLNLPDLSGATTFTASGPSSFASAFHLTTANQFLLMDLPNTRKLKLKLTPSTGIVQGAFFDATLRKTRKLQGVVLQAQGEISGFFLSDTDAGEWALSASE